MSLSKTTDIRHIVLVATEGADNDTLQAVTEFEGFQVTRVANPDELDQTLARCNPAHVRLVIDDGRADGLGSRFLATLHRHPEWMEKPIIYMSEPGRPTPPEPGIVLKKPVTGPILARTLRALGELQPTTPTSRETSSVERFGDYELLAKIASGGMGTVYLAQRRNQVGFHRLHALKVMHPHLVEDPEVSASFLDEATVASRVHHGNVAAIVDLGVENDRPFIVMQYVEGCSFSTLLRAKRGPAPPTLVGAIMIGVLDGLHAAHTLIDDDGAPMSIVHRDVSPDNILVGIDGIARIADFGIAKARNRVSTTEQGIRKGKLLYLSPEQLQDMPLDPRVDVYASGVVLWNALTGRRLFAADSPAQVLSNIASAKIIPPSEIDDAIPPALDTVCLRALARDRDERYSSAAEMAQALRRAMVDLGASVSPLDVGAWVRSVCGDELEARRVLARQRRRNAGLPTTSVRMVPVVSESTPTGDSGHTHLAVTEFSTPASKEGSWTPHHAAAALTPPPSAPPPAPPAPRAWGWGPFAAVGVVSIAVGALLSARCNDTAPDTIAVRDAQPVAQSSTAPEAKPESPRGDATPSTVEPEPKPAVPEPAAPQAGTPTPPTKPAPSAPKAAAPKTPAPAQQDAEPAAEEESSSTKSRRRRKRKKPETPPKTEPAPAPVSKPAPKPPAVDPLAAGPDRNPYKSP